MKVQTDIEKYLSLCNTVYTKTSKHICGGCTIDLRGVEPQSGYVVGVFGATGLVFNSYAEFSNLDVLKFIKDNTVYLDFENIYLGSWLNPANNKVYLNICKVVSTRKHALNMARLHNQSAYYDIENDNIIKT